MSNFKFGPASEAKLVGVNPKLVAVARLALQYTSQDFGVHDGVRTVEFQAKLVSSGASQTMASKHLVQADGFGAALDLVPYVGGSLRWEWGPIYPVAEAVRKAAKELGVSLTWGGAWDVDFTNSLLLPPERMVQAYVQKRRAGGKSAFIDGPHYELR